MLEQTAAGRHRLKEEQAEKKAKLEAEQAILQSELASLKGLFTGRRRKEIEKRLSGIKVQLEVGENDIPGIPE